MVNENSDIKTLRILGTFRQMASIYGISGFTLEDVAHQLNISKKSIYVSFKNKEEIISILLHKYLDEFQTELQFPLIKGNSAQQLSHLLLKIFGLYQLITSEVILTLKKQYKQTFSTFEHFETVILIRSIENNLEFGIENQEYRKSLNSNILAHFIVPMVKYLLHNHTFEQPNYHHELCTHFIQGLLTQKE